MRALKTLGLDIYSASFRNISCFAFSLLVKIQISPGFDARPHFATFGIYLPKSEQGVLQQLGEAVVILNLRARNGISVLRLN